MKIIITTNEILSTARTFNTFPGIFKGFISDEKILNKFYNELRLVASKTSAFMIEINMETVTIDIKEEFYIEMINEFGGMINGICSIVMGVGTRMKMIADKYKVKEDDLSEKPKSDVGIDSHTSKNNMYSIHKNSFDIKQELLKSGISNNLNVDSINSVLVGVSNKIDIRLYDSCKIDSPVDDDLVLEALIICGQDSLGAVVRNLKTDNKYIREFYFENGNIHIIKSDDRLFTIYPIEGIYIDHMDNQMGKRYYLFFTNIDKVEEFCENNDFNIGETKPKEKKINFYNLDRSMVRNSILIKNHSIGINEYDTNKKGLIRDSIQIDGLIFHSGKIYEVIPLSGGTDMAIYLITKDDYILAGNICRVLDTYEVQIDNHDDTSAMWILFFNNLDNMHLFLDKNFGL